MSSTPNQYSPATAASKPEHPYRAIPLEQRIAHIRNVPKELHLAPQWVLFKLIPKMPDGGSFPLKWDKVPFYASGAKRHGEQGTPQDRSSLVTLPAAVRALRARSAEFDGVGFACLEGGLASVIDLDGAESVDSHSSLVSATWAEQSVSGIGMHAFYLGTLGTNKKRKGLEAFSTKGFVAVTGIQPRGAKPRPLAHAAQVAPLVHTLLGSTPDDSSAAATPRPGGNPPRGIASPMTPELRRKLRAAMRVLDPDMGYETWHQIGMALHATNPSVDGPAFSLWDAWSSKGTKYCGKEDLIAHWRSFHAGGGITEGTIFSMSDREDRDWRKRFDKAPESKQPPPPTNATASEEFSGPRVTITMLDSIEPEAQPWLLRHVFARGELTLLTGDGGTNKSSLAHAIAHILVNGGIWPLGGFEYSGENIPPQGEVLIMCGEEGLSTSIVPRLKVQGTNRSKVGVIDLATDYDENGHVLGGIATFSEHLRLIEHAILTRGAGKVCMLIIDPLTGYLGVENQNAESDVRPVLLSMVQMARRLGVAICAIMHLNKKTDIAASDRILGSVAFKNVARVALSVIRDPDSPEDRRYCIVTKSNLGAQQVGLSLRRVDHRDPLDAHGKIITVDIDNEAHRGIDADALMKELAVLQRIQGERAGTLADSVMQVIAGATQALTGAEVRELVEPAWRQMNDGRELPPSWVQMVDNALSRLCRARRVHRLRHNRGSVGHRGALPQLYTVIPEGMGDILG